MSDALLHALAEALADMVVSIDTCDDGELDPDTAVAWLEGTGAVLDRLPPADRRTLARLLRAAADRRPPGRERQALLRVPDGLGLDDDQHELYCDAVEDLVGSLVRLARDADPATPVPARPGRTLADLVRHHGTTHRWVAHTVRIRAAERVWAHEVPADLPDDPAGYPDWLVRSADASLSVLRKADPDTPMWSQGADQRIAHYPRRLLFEALVHLSDVQAALSEEPHIGPATAADGIAEFLENLPHAPHLAQPLAALPVGSVGLTARDTGAAWTVRFGPGGLRWTACAGPADVQVEAPAATLLLLVYGRRRPGDPEVSVRGDRAVLDAWLAATAL
ncbi:maleylpyruvate isomerase family mycothiol-dependent enzyme [Streptomyces sp. NPDC090029]|uniref:maleylpyruvate isomerase family mycothiol-dependent enzyme n=1 Tax=Streptomyces sp. NPDC090029 TaxID=3365924 RepID=UPI0037F345AF